jgi:tRNA threonylcarbamoyladenosine biosynthesis protein TsaE
VQTTELTLRTATPEETRDAAAAVASAFRPGDVVSLTGELGAGKTCFVQGAARAMGVEGRVTSPTFMLVRLYDEATPPIVHCDVYRLDRLQDVLDLGDEVLASDVVTFVEWGDAVASLLPADRLEVEVVLADDETSDSAFDGSGRADDAAGDGAGARLVRLRGLGTWGPRVDELSGHCARWLEESR